MLKIAISFAVLVILGPLLAHCAEDKSNDTSIVQREFIYDEAPFPQCHASTIEETKSGLVAAWFGGTREGHDDVGIWVSRQTDGKWSKPVEVATGEVAGDRHPCWNPVLFQPKDGPLLLFYKVGPDPQRWWGMLRRSTDGGATWSEAERLPDGFLGPVKNKPIELASGELLCPSSTETPTKPSQWRVHFERTPDLGKTWTKTAPPEPGQEPVQAIQPSILQHGENQLQAIGRSRSKRLFETWSNDGGKSWNEVKLTDLPNPNSGTDAVTLKDGRHLLVYNDTPSGRTPLSVALSEDGKTWRIAQALETEPGEYSYPAVIQTADGRVHITYTWKRQKVRHIVLDPEQLGGAQ
jgi:predicted neuraminidase